MRNLKKILAAITVIAMLASMMVVPALAEGFKYEEEATILNELKLMEGMGLGDSVNRLQGLIFAIKAAGLKDEVDAMTDEEAAAILAEKVVDADEVPAWGVKWTAYAVEKGFTSGVDASVAPKVKFAPLQEVSATSFLVWIMNIGMGYKYGTDVVVAEAVNANVISLSQAMEIGAKAAIIRDDAAGILYGACKNGVNADGKTFIQSLIDAGVVTEEAAIAAGLVEAKPEVLEVVGVSALNLVQVEVEFNQPVDEDSAKDKGNYKIDKVAIKNVDLLDDGKTVVLTFKADDARKQQDKVDLTIDGVKSANGKKIEKTTIKGIEFIDTEIPTVVDGSVIGSDTIKIVFSEPMDPKTVKKANFSVNSGKLYIKEVKLQNNYTEALVVLYSNLKEGEVTVQVKSGNEDFAGFGVVGKLLTLTVVEDKEAPYVVGYEKASKNGVTLIWNEDIKFNGAVDLDDYYHTNSKNYAGPDKNNRGSITNMDDYVKIEGNKLTIKFDAKERPMPEVAYVYVLKEAVKDYWGNKNTQQMIKVEYDADEEPPVVEEIEVKSQSQIVIKFNEELDGDSANDKKNYTLLDKNGKEIRGIIKKAEYANKKVTITFNEDLNGDYAIVIEKVKDTSDNEIEKVTMSFTVEDKTKPDISKFKAKIYKAGDVDQLLKVSFGEAMATEGKYSVLDLEKYTVDGRILADIDDVEITAVDDYKAVEIKIPSREDLIEDGVEESDIKAEDHLDVQPGMSIITVTRVADAAGNYMSEPSWNGTIEASSYIEIDKVEATARDKIVITLKDELHDFEIDDLLITTSAAITEAEDKLKNDLKALKYAEVDTSLNDDGNTVITITLAEKLTHEAKISEGDNDVDVYVYVIGEESENVYGETLKKDYGKKWAVPDKIAPELYDDGQDDTPTQSEKNAGKIRDYLKVYANSFIDIKFSEPMENLSFADWARAGNDLIVTANGDVLVNGVDYVVVGLDDEDDSVIEIRLLGDYVGFDGDIEIATAEKINYLKDAAGNKIAKFEIDSFEVSFVPEFESAKITTTNAIEITISEKLAGSEGNHAAFTVVVTDAAGKNVTVSEVAIKDDKVTLTLTGDPLDSNYKIAIVYNGTDTKDLTDKRENKMLSGETYDPYELLVPEDQQE
jgi:hypothetical protein